MTRVMLDRLTKRFGAVTAVDGIALAIAEGEFLVLLGPSGCGKTTTLRCIAGLEDITDGRILMGDTVVSAPGRTVPPEARAIGMVFQSYAVWPHMTVFENVAFGLKLKRHLARAGIEARVRQALDLVGLDAVAERGIHQLSGGQQQRVALARAVVLEPRVLLFDEPLSNLDAKLRQHMRFELRQLQRRLGITSIYVTHDQEEAMVIADRVVLMRDGRIAQIGSPMDIYNRPISLFVASFIGATNALRGAVVAANGTSTRVRIAGGLELMSSDIGFSAGSEIDVLCRPEHFSISRTALDGPNVLAARVEDTVFLGSLADIHLAAGEHFLRAQVSPAAYWAPGTPAWLQVHPENVRLLHKSAPPRDPAIEEAPP